MYFITFILKRYLKINHISNFSSFVMMASIISTAIGMASLIIVIGIINGFRSNLISEIVKNKSHITIKIQKNNINPIYTHIIKHLNKNLKVSRVCTNISTQAIISGKKKSTGIFLIGTHYYEKPMSYINSKLSSAKQILRKKPAIFLSSKILKKLNLKMGDEIYVTIPKGISSPLGYMPYKKKFYAYPKTNYNAKLPIANIAIKETENLSKTIKFLTKIEIKTIDPFDTKDIEHLMLSKFKHLINIKNWKEMNSGLFYAIKMEKIISSILITLISIIVASGIITFLTIDISNKKNDIAILKTMGINNNNIHKIFIIKGLVLGIFGILLGVLFGILISIVISKYSIIKLSVDLNNLTTIPIKLNMKNIFTTITFSLFILFIAIIYPIKRASNFRLKQSLDSIN